MNSDPRPPPPVPVGSADQALSRRTTSETLFQGASRVFIEHKGEIYCLRWTKNGKLILTK